MNQQQFARLNGLSTASNSAGNSATGRLNKNTKQQAARQTQPLSVSQLANIQAQEAQYAREKLSATKSFNLEDDLAFYPDHIETRRPLNLNLNQRMVVNPLSPYSTPTKTVQYGQQQVHRLGGYISPGHVVNSPQHQHQHQHQHQQRVLNHTQVFNSPQPQNLAIRGRLDLSNASPMYHNSANIRHW